MPVVFGRLGTRALPALSQVLANPKCNLYARQDAVDSMKEILERNPDSRETCLQILTSQLEQFGENHPNLNGYLVTILAVDMKALETAELIEQAYQSGRVNEDFVGD